MKVIAIFVLAVLAIHVSASSVALRLKAQIEANPMSADSLGSQVISSQSLVGSASIPTPSPASMSASVAGSMASMASMAAVPGSESSVAIPATQLQQPGSQSAVAPGSSSSSSSGCQPQMACDSSNSDISVEDAVKPIDQWMKDFKSRTSGSGGDLIAAAKSTVAPLIQKLKRNQDSAEEKLHESNAAILQHVEEAATEHVYNLLRAEHISEEKEASAEQKKAKAAEVADQLAQKKLEAKLLESSESSKKF